MLKSSLAFGASCLALAGVATAQTPAVDERDQRIRDLEHRIEMLTERVEALTAATETRAAQPAATAPTPTPAPTDVRVSLANGRPTIQTADGANRFALRSLVQLDAAAYDQEAGAAQDLSSGTNFRRARLGFEGVAYRDWAYEVTFEFGGSGQEDAGKLLAGWIEYRGLPVRVRAGAFAPSVGLDDATSSGDTLFLERGAAAEMTRAIAAGDGRIGIGATQSGERWFASAALTGAVAAQASTFDEQSAFVGRLAGLALKNDHLVLHVGANYSNVFQLADTSAGAGTDSARLQERPELRVDGTRLVDTGALNADGMTSLGGEVGMQAGPFLFTAEAIQYTIERTGGLPDAEFGGWHAQAAWSITGEERTWSNSSGAFSSARVANIFNPAEGKWGAWEVAARYSVLDLNDNETAIGLQSTMGAPTSIIRGGEQSITTLGLNWRPHPLLRMMLNYQDMEIDRLDAAGVTQVGQDIEAVSLRTQLAF